MPADRAAVQNRGAHADERLVADRAAVQNRAVPDGDALAHPAGRPVIGMQDGVILDVALAADSDGLNVASQARARPDAHFVSEFHSANDRRALVNPNLFSYFRKIVTKRKNSHAKSRLLLCFESTIVMQDKENMRMDLHMHSSASDGVYSPALVMQKAHDNGAEVVALTDHDTVAGLDEAREAAARLGMRFINGVELSVTWGGKTVHIVGLGFKRMDLYRELTKTLSDMRARRARAMAAKFDAMGIYNTYEQAAELSGNKLNLSRRHFAMALVERGTVASEDEAFERYLKDDGPAYVKTSWQSLAQAVSLIRETGGVPVVAHPGRYTYKPPLSTIDMLEEFKALGGEAIEVTTGSHTPGENERYARVAANMGFLASTGSDFHGLKPGRPEPALQEQLPADLPTVLELLDS